MGVNHMNKLDTRKTTAIQKTPIFPLLVTKITTSCSCCLSGLYNCMDCLIAWNCLNCTHGKKDSDQPSLCQTGKSRIAHWEGGRGNTFISQVLCGQGWLGQMSELAVWQVYEKPQRYLKSQNVRTCIVTIGTTLIHTEVYMLFLQVAFVFSW